MTDTDTLTLKVSEIFGPTVQGEGATQGRRAAFLRLGRCNLDCSWCDTPYTWDWKGKNGVAYDPAALLDMRPDEIIRRLVARRTRLVVISGGEPLLQRRGLLALLTDLLPMGKVVEIETNGTLPPLEEFYSSPWAPAVHYNVSPKLANSGIDRARRINHDVLARFVPLPSIFKFVVEEVSDFDELDSLVVGLGLTPGRVWVQPQARQPEELIDRITKLIEPIVERGYNLSGRLHVMAWGDERGR